MFILPTLVAFLPVFAAGQIYGPPPGPASSTSAASFSVPSAPPNSPGQVNIDVAFNGQFMFHPANVTAPNGTLVTFFFPASSLTHSVTQSSFANPCTYLASNGSGPAGFDSGLTQAVQFTINITDDAQPIWFFCKQVSHCGQGMVGSINAPMSGSNTFEAFQAAALAIGGEEQNVPDNGPVTGGVNGVVTAPPAATISGSSSGSGGTNSGTVKVQPLVGLLLLAATCIAYLV